MWHNFVPRSSREGMILFWVFIEPAAQLAILMVLFTIIGRNAGYGTSFAMFLLSGISVLNLYTTTSSAVMGAVTKLGNPRRLATVGMFAPALAVAGFRLTIAVVSTIVLFHAVRQVQHLESLSIDIVACVEAFFLTAVMGLGMGMVRGYSRMFVPIFDRVYGIVSRALLFISGVFYVPSFLPPAFREYLAWNPVLHAIDWFRTGIYASYPELVLSRGYLIGFTVGSVALGMALIWHDRRRILQ